MFSLPSAGLFVAENSFASPYARLIIVFASVPVSPSGGWDQAKIDASPGVEMRIYMFSRAFCPRYSRKFDTFRTVNSFSSSLNLVSIFGTLRDVQCLRLYHVSAPLAETESF